MDKMDQSGPKWTEVDQIRTKCYPMWLGDNDHAIPNLINRKRKRKTNVNEPKELRKEQYGCLSFMFFSYSATQPSTLQKLPSFSHCTHYFPCKIPTLISKTQQHNHQHPHHIKPQQAL